MARLSHLEGVLCGGYTKSLMELNAFQLLIIAAVGLFASLRIYKIKEKEGLAWILLMSVSAGFLLIAIILRTVLT